MFSALTRPLFQLSRRDFHRSLIKRNSYNDASKPFPPPQPTRPVDMINDMNNNANATSPTLDAIVEDSNKKEHSFTADTSFRRSHHFDTYELLTFLENHGFKRKQAEVIMKGIKFRIRECTASVKQQLLFASDLENDTYLFKAALSELRTEIQIMRRNDIQMLQNELSLITREVEGLEQKLNESLADLKNEIQMDMNNRKNETREEQKSMDIKIQEINNKFTLQLGDIRTEIEAVRWETIWKGLTGVVLAGLTISSLGYLLNKHSNRKKAKLEADRKQKLIEEKEANIEAGAAEMEVIF
ncbi:uncharacterized protein BX663DRAFT_523071 [Cokeromyces recurvatus]|uniref:uncharacterized protein n=1 Tax=Cokeromyces recurvatus TaxID=90255 RepID=UPI00221F87A6|nr:uncharacterized protein BX663DRAFT_523071 [Cokeromyces recurvatus]KAI7898858.1 hypothetical protein BX663DRAFT_523071 [Cokeromyces recurvatus]